jgi:hypothetical protein
LKQQMTLVATAVLASSSQIRLALGEEAGACLGKRWSPCSQKPQSYHEENQVLALAGYS